MFWRLLPAETTNYMMEKYTEAIADFDRAISLDGDNLQALVNHRRKLYRLMEKYTEALDDFDRAIA